MRQSTPSVPIRIVDDTEKALIYGKLRFRVPNYEDELIKIVQELGQDVNFSGVRLPLDERNLVKRDVFRIEPEV